jgi:hypothetical protein
MKECVGHFTLPVYRLNGKDLKQLRPIRGTTISHCEEIRDKPR